MRWLFELTMFFGRNSWRRKCPNVRLECQSASRACSTKSPLIPIFGAIFPSSRYTLCLKGFIFVDEISSPCLVVFSWFSSVLVCLFWFAFFVLFRLVCFTFFSLHFQFFSPCHTSEGCGALKHRKVTVEKGARPNLEPPVVGKFALKAGKGLFILLMEEILHQLIGSLSHYL